MRSSPSPLLLKLRLWWLLHSGSTLLLLGLRIVALGLPLLGLYMYADAVFSLPEATRRTWNLLLPGLCLGLGLIGLRAPGSLADLALRLDRFRRDRRRTISCALDLSGPAADKGSLHLAMRARAVQDGLDALRATPFRAAVPFSQLLFFAGTCLLLGAGAAHLARVHAEIVQVVGARLANPGADLPPWTPLQFEFLPDAPEVVYGGDVQVGVRITGGTPAHPVMLRTRIDGVERDAGCFREQDNQFSQRLESVTRPVAYCFMIGRVRSPWRTVEVHTLPQVTSARVQVLPPEYTGRSPQTFAFGARGIEAFAGSQVRLTLESNRPLSGGELTLRHAGGSTQVRAVLLPDGRAEFRWMLERSAEIEVRVRDLQGQGTVSPLEGSQRALPDQRPLAVITEPSRFTLATPDTRLRVEGYGSDDIGVTRLTLVRGMSGFIDRPDVLWEGEPQRRQGFERVMDLQALGVEPGQVLELYLEARDHRPERPETGVSDMVRVQVITTEEYAEQLRNRELLEGFRQRFALRSNVLNEVAEAYRTLHEILEGDPDREEVDAALAEAASVLRRAEEAFAALEEDFPIFDVEQGGAESIRALRSHFAQQAETLASLSHRDPHLDLQVQEMGAAFLDLRGEMSGQEQDEAAFLAFGALMEHAVEFQRLIQRQEILEREFARFAYSLPPGERERLRRLQEHQRALEEDLRNWITGARERAEALPDDFEEWREHVENMVRGLEASGAGVYMRDAADSALNEAHRQAWQFSRAALDALRAPGPEEEGGEGGGEEGNPFGQMCRGGSPGMPSGQCEGGGLANSLNQLLRALRHGIGRGTGGSPGGSGGGPGGFSDDGYAVQGSSSLAIPLLGPNRLNLQLPRGQAVEGYTLGRGRGGDRRGEERAGESPEAGDEGLSAEEIRIHQAPPRYREAIRHFFEF